MKKLWSRVTKWQKLFVVTLVLAGILWMTGFNPVDSGAGPREVEAETIIYSGQSGDLNWSIDSANCLRIEGEGDYSKCEWNQYYVNIGKAVIKVKNITSLKGLFHGCSNLRTVDLSDLDTTNVTDMSYMFYDCYNLKNVDMNGIVTTNVTNMSNMFAGCYNLEKLDVSGFDTKNVTDMSRMFYDCGRVGRLDVSGFDTSNVTNMSKMFYACRVSGLAVSGFNTKNVTNMSGLFSRCSELRKIDVSKFDTSNVVDMSNMFESCMDLTEIDVSGFDTSNVTDMSGMFDGCTGLEKLDVSGFNTSNVMNMRSMFEYCSEMEKLDVSGFNVKNVTDMSRLFYRCVHIRELDISKFYSPNVINMNRMFFECAELKKINLSNFDAKNVTDIEKMFSGCKRLRELDLSGLDISNVVNADGIFNECINLASINTPVNGTEKKGLLPTSTNRYWFDSDENIYEYLPGDINYSLSLNLDIPKLKSDFVMLGSTTYEYTGSPIQPEVTVKDASEKLLTEDVDYTVFYENNTNAGTAKVVVTGKGNYKGTVTVEFTINPKVLILKDEDITIDNNGFVNDGNIYQYTGEEIKPVLTVNGLTEGTDYELSYENNIEEGTATVTAICKGNYNGEYIYKYRIIKDLIFTWDNDNCMSDIGTPEVTVKERTNPTCAKAGRILYVATLEHMGKVYTSENEVQLPATGKHSWDKGVVKGSKLIYTCKVCKQTQSVERKVKSIAITGLSHNIAAGKKIALTATVLPANAINKKVVWTTSNKKVATVSQSGIVSVLKNTGKKSVIITATAADGSGVKRSFKITSMKGIVTKVSLSGKNTLAVGKSQKVKATVKASAGAYKSLKWTSSNVKYATVSSNGTVKAQKAGKGKKVTITAMALDGSGKKATFSIKIK